MLNLTTQKQKYAVQGLYSASYGYETVDIKDRYLDAIRKRMELDKKEPDIEHRIKTIKQGGQLWIVKYATHITTKN